MFKKLILAVIVAATCGLTAVAQGMQAAGIAFYNLENLFDTIPNNDLGRALEYTPGGKNQWDSRKYANKLHNLAYAISQLPTKMTPRGPVIIGVSEVENRTVLEDLVKQPEIAAWNLQICHHDSPDRRGIDVGLLYNPKYFKVENVTNHRLTAVPFATRDQMCVVGSLLGQRIGIIVNHWPSRLGGQEQSSPNREAAADPRALHAMEHLVATFLRNHPQWAPKTVYWGPMGCCTGNYLILQGELESSDVVGLMREAMEFVADFEGEIPGATARDCGNYTFMDLDGAKVLARKFLQESSTPGSDRLHYPA